MGDTVCRKCSVSCATAKKMEQKYSEFSKEESKNIFGMFKERELREESNSDF